MSAYLVDTSVWHLAARHGEVRDRLSELPGSLHTCLIVALEMGVSARNQKEHDAAMRLLTNSTADAVLLTEEVEGRAVAMQRALTRGGKHRAANIADLLIAATAEVHGLTVLHYDSDFDLITAVTGAPCEWIVKRGSIVP